MKFAQFTSEGFPSGFYSLDIHGDGIPDDAVEITDEQWLEFLSNQGLRRWQDGEVVPHEPQPEPPTVNDYRAAIQSHLDAAAQSRNYDSGTTIATYVNSTNPAWAAEAQAFVAWRDAVWAYAYVELDKVTTGARPQPSVEDLVAELPEIEWQE